MINNWLVVLSLINGAAAQNNRGLRTAVSAFEARVKAFGASNRILNDALEELSQYQDDLLQLHSIDRASFHAEYQRRMQSSSECEAVAPGASLAD